MDETKTAVANFEGHQPRHCGEHRTVGPHRAWCFDCQEWCYPDEPCARCERPAVEAELAAQGIALQRVYELTRRKNLSADGLRRRLSAIPEIQKIAALNEETTDGR